MYAIPKEAPPAAAVIEPLRLIPSRIIRQGDHPELPVPIPGLLEGYLTILAGAGGVGKTYLAEQVARHLASQVQLGRFPLPEAPVTTWFLVLEDVAALTQARSLEVAGFGTLAEDQSPEDIGCDSLLYITDGCRGIASLRLRLEAARESGEPLPGAVIIDYLHLFIGSKPSGADPVDWERRRLTELRELGEEFGCHILVLTHMNKQGKVNGTSALLNACDSMYTLDLKDDRDYAVLACAKMRMAPMVDYTLCRKSNGSWGFDDQVWVSEVQAEGIIRDVLRILRQEGPKTLSGIVNHHQVTGQRAGVRAALSRARNRGHVRWTRGHWMAVPGGGDQNLMAAPPRLCKACQNPMTLPGDDYHPCCDPEVTNPSAPVALVPPPRTEDPVDEWQEPPTEERARTALDDLKRSVDSSRYHPVKVIAAEEREQLPWTLITEEMGGEPKWYAPGWSAQRVRWQDETGKHQRLDLKAPAGWDIRHGAVVLLDRNGSYPSACSSVPLAPNRLVHTGPMATHIGRAGLFLVQLAAPWDTDTFPHPLGIAAQPDNAPSWVTTPHVKLLTKLGLSYTILDSWTGKRNESLFERFYKDARDVRLRTGGGDNPEYVHWKSTMGPALRLLWPKGARSPYWRPDWRVSLVAEASVRHWSKAWQAAHESADRQDGPGGFLVALANVDEAAWWSWDGELPAGYEVGGGFGQVEIKRWQDGDPR